MSTRKFQISFSTRNSLKASNFKFQINKGYTLIEILVVMTLIGLAVGLITTSYLGFERRQRLKNAALEVKNDIRLVENNAHSGNKGFGDRPDKSDRCEDGERLVGWYVHIDENSDAYWIAGDCVNNANIERKFGKQTFPLPQDVNVSTLSADNNQVGEVNILYRPLTENVTFHSSPSFLNSDGSLNNLVTVSSQVVVDLQGPTPYKYQVIILPTGEVNEKQL